MLRTVHTRLRMAVLAISLATAGLTGTLATSMPVVAHASAALAYHPGYSVQGSWLCYGWPDGAYHCTQHWAISGGRYISYNTAWVPSEQTAPAPVVTVAHPVTSTPAVRVGGGGNTTGYPWGQCTWGAARLSWDNVSYLGNARDWLWNARARGLPTGYTPRVGATVVYQPYVQGASWLGHVAHVTQVFGDGSFEVEEMNYYGFGGGFGIFSYRHSWTGWGVAFIY